MLKGKSQPSAARAAVEGNAGLVAAALMLLAGCTSSPQPPDMARTSLKTAPADLQLGCASAAATQFGLPADAVLPVSSSQVDAQRYQVELNMRGERAICLVDTAGNVASVQKV